jgi:hypothetical protein
MMQKANVSHGKIKYGQAVERESFTLRLSFKVLVLRAFRLKEKKK